MLPYPPQIAVFMDAVTVTIAKTDAGRVRNDYTSLSRASELFIVGLSTPMETIFSIYRADKLTNHYDPHALNAATHIVSISSP